MSKSYLESVDYTGRSRRKFIGETGMAIVGSLLGGARVFGATPPDAGNGYTGGDVRRYGISPNRTDAAGANTAALAALVSPSGSFSGKLVFPNAGGKDVYYFNDMIPFHDGIHVDLMQSTLHFSKIGVARDTSAGFLHAIRDFSIQNGSIVVDYTHRAGFNTGNALSFGGRGNDTVLFPNIYDSLLRTSMGKIVVRNVKISSNAGGGEGRGILMLGGLDGVLLENVTIDGQGQLLHGVYYEFGWATNEAKPYLRQTSHAHNFRIKNLVVSGVTSEGFTANGLYRAVIDGLKVSDSGGVCAFGPGESMFFRPWSGVPDRKTRPTIVLRNVVGESISNLGIGVTGASKLSSSYLDNPPAHNNPNGLRELQQSDLIDFSLDTFSISGSAKNYGIFTSAGKAVIRNGTLKGFQRGVVTTQECTKFLFESVNVLDSAGIGIQIGQSQSVHNPPRLASGVIRHCFIAGSGAAGASAAIVVGTTQGCVVESSRFGYDQSHDNKSERTQTQAVLVSRAASEVICRDNFVGGTASDAPAYVLPASPSGTQQCRLLGNSGVVTATGPWLTARQATGVQSLADRDTIKVGGLHVVWVTASAPVVGVGIQHGAQSGQTIVVVHQGAASNSIAFGASRGSGVAGGIEPIAGLTSSIMIWNGGDKLWHSIDPAQRKTDESTG